jgi:glycosyltransferase involved in cell wall biosynthesis
LKKNAAPILVQLLTLASGNKAGPNQNLRYHVTACYHIAMNNKKDIRLVIPAYNEGASIGLVVGDVPKQLVQQVIVVNNNSNDNTVEAAMAAGATVLTETRRGYGQACLTGLAHIRQGGGCDIVVFIDGDYSDHPEEMAAVLQPILNGSADMVIGCRTKANREPGSMTPQQVFGNWLAVFLIRLLFGHRYTDLGPFRAITWEALEKINMQDTNYGWTVEMQVKAVQLGLRCVDVPVSYRRRIGVSKISGTIKGTVMAGYKIIKTIFKYA